MLDIDINGSSRRTGVSQHLLAINGRKIGRRPGIPRHNIMIFIRSSDLAI